MLHDPFWDLPVHPECHHAVELTGKLLEGMGHKIEISYPPAFSGPTGLGLALRIISASALTARLDEWGEKIGRAITPEDVELATWERAEEGRTYRAIEIHAAYQRLIAGICRVPEWWAGGFDLLITPTMTQPPCPVELKDPEQLRANFGLFNFPASFTGQPAISLPMTISTAGLPIGVQVVADYGREDLLIQIASQLEQTVHWQKITPDLSFAD